MTNDGGGGFPTTHWSAVAGTRSEDPNERARSFGTLVAAYWKPVYKYIRVRWRKSDEDARDLTQEFFALAFEKRFFAPFDPARARFRTFLRTCLEGFLANQDKAARRLKRGGATTTLSLEFERAEGELASFDPPAPDDLDRYFDAEWVRSLLGLAVEALREECDRLDKSICFTVFHHYDLDPPAGGRPTYAELGAQLGLLVTQVTNHLAYARREFRRLLLLKLREITASDAEYRMEARYLLGDSAG